MVSVPPRMQNLHCDFCIGVSGVHSTGHMSVDADFEGVSELGGEGRELPLSVRRDSTGDDEADMVFGTLGVKGTEFMEASAEDTAVFEAYMHGSCLDEGKGCGGKEEGSSEE